MGHQPGRLVDDHQMIVLEDHVDRELGGRLLGGVVRDHLQAHVLTRDHAMVLGSRPSIHLHGAALDQALARRA